MTRAVWIVLVVAACQKDRGTPAQAKDAAVAAAAPTCADMARHGVELALEDPSQTAERKQELAAHRDEAIAGGTTACEQLKPPPEVLACMIAAKTYAEYAACGDRFTP